MVCVDSERHLRSRWDVPVRSVHDVRVFHTLLARQPHVRVVFEKVRDTLDDAQRDGPIEQLLNGHGFELEGQGLVHIQ